MEYRPQNFQSTQKMKFTKTETEYNMKSLRFLLLMITTMFLIIAGLMIVLGISVYSHYHSFTFFYESAKSGRFFTPSVLSVILGIVMLVVTSFGFFGTLKLSTCMVNLYAVILAVVLILKLIVVILAFTTSNSLIKNYIDIPVWGYTSDAEIQDEIDQLQVTLNCCGSSSYLDYMGMEFTANQSTVMVNKEVEGELMTLVVPESCCISAGDYVCARMRSAGCKDALINVISQNSSVLGVLGVSVMFIQLLGIIFSLLLAHCIRKLKSERTLQSWQKKEQFILAREANQRDQTIYIDHADVSVA